MKFYLNVYYGLNMKYIPAPTHVLKPKLPEAAVWEVQETLGGGLSSRK
jgi:hypothetical protein